MGKRNRKKRSKARIQYSKPSSKPVWGYCESIEHRGYLTRKAIEDHGCLDKKCKNLRKCHPEYWEGERKQKINKSLGKYFRRREKIRVMYGSLENFLTAVGNYYGGVHNVPYEFSEGIDISGFIQSIM